MSRRITLLVFATLMIFNTIVSLAQSDSVDMPEQITDTVTDAKTEPLKVYIFDMKEMIAPPVWRTTQKAFEKAREINADLILIHMNTYGGMVDAADSIRTKLLNSEIPVYVFIDNNAASAGALISIACDSIYMAPGANIGAATVVNQSGEVVPDKFQSYMRSMMRSTAEAKGRDPEIAEAMVDPRVYIEGISDTGQVLTFTTSEAMLHGFCEGQAESIEEVLAIAGHTDYVLVKHELNSMDRIINFLISPAISGLLIMIIIGGLYFELQTPGVGFPLAASVTAAMLYFAPLYLEGLASHWEIIIFVIGVILLLVEIFAIPGFGITGILGVLFMVTGLTLAMVESIGETTFHVDIMQLTQAFFIVIISIFLALAGSIYLSKQLFASNGLAHLALETVQDKEDGFTTAFADYTIMIGKSGITRTILRPSGKIDIEGEMYDATALNGYIDEGEPVEVVSYQTGQLFVRKA